MSITNRETENQLMSLLGVANTFLLFVCRFRRRPTRPARQGCAWQERVAGHERVPTAALVTVPHKGHQPIYSGAAATAARHGGKSQHDG